jgi:uncharacterized protein YkwD
LVFIGRLRYRAVTGAAPQRLLAGLALGAVLAGLGVFAVVPETWSVALAGQSTPAAPQTAAPVIRVVAPPPTTDPPALPAPLAVAAPVAEAIPTAPTTTSNEPPPPARTTAALPTTDIPVATGPAARVVALTNAARERAGCDPLTTDARITAAAQDHSADMAARDYFAHDSLDGRDFADRLRAAGYPDPGAENIAMGQQTADEVVAAWLDSPGHRRNIEDCSLRTIGVGHVPGGDYWTQDFGR